jgi:Tfp pilus assembly protein PilV
MRSSEKSRIVQRGSGLIEVLVASVLLAVALAVLLGSLSPLLVGSQVGQRRTIEERLARSQMEELMAQPATCDSSQLDGPTIDSEGYRIVIDVDCSTPGLASYRVTVKDSAGGGLSLTDERLAP